MKKFYDISEHNTINNYEQLKSDGVIIKATEGMTYKDSKTDKYYTMLNGKLPIGFYHMLCVTSSPEGQAEEFYNRIKNYEQQIMPVLDVEYENLGELAQEYTFRFCNEYQKLSGIVPIIYTGEYYQNLHFSKDFISQFYWWIAKYSSKAPYCENMVAWQFTGDGIDTSYLYNENNFYINGNYTQEVKNDVELTNDIMVLQNELNIQGFKDKNGNQLTVDGFVGELTLSALPTLRIGATGNIIRWVQSRIGVDTDGIFGDQTYRRIISIQKDNNLVQDGIVGKNTWRVIL